MTVPAQPSPLGPAITAYIDRKRSLGFKYDNEARILQELDAFLAGHGLSELTSEGFGDWALTLEPLKPQGRLKKMRIVRNFTLHHRRTAPECFVPDPARFPTPSQRLGSSPNDRFRPCWSRRDNSSPLPIPHCAPERTAWR